MTVPHIRHTITYRNRKEDAEDSGHGAAELHPWPPALHFLAVCFLLLAVLCPKQCASASSVITDIANLLSTEETEQILAQCDSILERYGTSIYIVSTDKMGGRDDFEGYMEQIADNSDAPEDMVILFIGTKKNDRVYQIFGYGKAETFLTHDRCNKVMDRMQKDLRDGQYFSALQTFCMQVRFYLERDPKFDHLIFHPLPQLILSLILSMAVVFLMARNIAGKSAPSAKSYIDSEHSHLLGRIDHFTHMTVHRVKHTDSSGKGSGKGSGGGRSHSSGTPHSF